MRISEMITEVRNGRLDSMLERLYGAESVAAQQERYISIMEKGQALFGDREAMLFSAPGRTEVGGNHTDHQLGRVVAASIDLDVAAVVIPSDDHIIRYASKGFSVKPVDLKDLSIHEDEKNTTEALIRGTAAGLNKMGYGIGGFMAYAESNVLPGGGMSSSAAFEVLLGTILNDLYNGGKITPEEIAKNGQYAENVYFMKPCGLLDQMACAEGSFTAIDFYEKDAPKVHRIGFDPGEFGYDLILTDVRASHAELSDEYAAVPADMKAAAAVMHEEVLSRCTLNDLLANAAEIREKCGDRALMRAFHFLKETERAGALAAAMERGDIASFLDIVNESGRSSYMYLQNINVPGAVREQPVGLALTLSDAVLEGRGAFRVHGGGFAGTIQAYVPHELTEKYIAAMESVFDKDCCYILKIRDCGGIRMM